MFDYEVVRYVDGFFEPSSLVVSARFGYICCVEKAFHVTKLRDRLFAPQAFNSLWFYSHAKTLHEYRYCKLLVDHMRNECETGQVEVGKLQWQLFTARYFFRSKVP